MKETYDYVKEWDEVLPDGIAFLHWGGVDLSNLLISKLNPLGNDRIIDLCCGYGGTLSLIKQGELYGIDTDPSAVASASKYSKAFVADANNLPSDIGYFDKSFSQDPDIMLSGSAEKFLSEARRISNSLIIQTYAANGDLTRFEEELSSLDYPLVDVVSIDSLIESAYSAGWNVEENINLHREYTSWTKRMLAQSTPRFIPLFETELELFSEGALTGRMLVLS